MIELGAATVIAADRTAAAAVAHVQLASAVPATQQSSQQRLAPAQGPAYHLPLHVGVVGDHALIVFLGAPINVAVMVRCLPASQP